MSGKATRGGGAFHRLFCCGFRRGTIKECVVSRWTPRHNKKQVLELFDKQPMLKSTEMAKLLKCEPAYIRATLSRAGLLLARSKRDTPSLCGYNSKVDEILNLKLTSPRITPEEIAHRTGSEYHYVRTILVREGMIRKRKVKKTG